MDEHDAALARRLKEQASRTTEMYLLWEREALVRRAEEFLATATQKAVPPTQAGLETATNLAGRAGQMYAGAADLANALATLGGTQQQRKDANGFLNLADAAKAQALAYARQADALRGAAYLAAGARS